MARSKASVRARISWLRTVASGSPSRAASTEPPTCLAFNGYSNALEHAGRALEADSVCRRAISLLPDCHLAYYNLGRLLKDSVRLTEAPRLLSVARDLDPSQRLYANAHGTALQSMGREGEARDAYMRAVEMSPDWSSPYRNLGLLEYAKGGRAREAHARAETRACARALRTHQTGRTA